MSGKEHQGPADRAIGALAERQYGLVTRAQLFELGVSADAIDYRIKVGRLRPVHRGVYTVGHRLLTQNGRWLAAVLACGDGAVLSHRAAAGLWGLRNETRIEVTVPRTRKTRPGIRVHRIDLPPDEITTRHRIPTTTVPRTLLDLSGGVPRDELRSMMRQAETNRLTDTLTLGDLIERYPRRPGIANARAIHEEAQRGMGVTRRELEERFQAFLLNAAFPVPTTNTLIEGFEVDCAWRGERLIVELDGRATHDTPHAFEADRLRDRTLSAHGWRVVRITWRQLHDQPAEVEADLRKLLCG
jgi:very-short-patch-repair endonuclease